MLQFFDTHSKLFRRISFCFIWKLGFDCILNPFSLPAKTSRFPVRPPSYQFAPEIEQTLARTRCFELQNHTWGLESLWVIYQTFGEPRMPLAGGMAGTLAKHTGKNRGTCIWFVLCDIFFFNNMFVSSNCCSVGPFFVGCMVACASMKRINTFDDDWPKENRPTQNQVQHNVEQ